MKEFEKFLEEGKVQERTSKPDQAENLIRKARKRFEHAEERSLGEGNADLILEDVYEAIREAVEAHMLRAGYKSYNHEASIIYAFEELGLKYSQVNNLNRFRRLRNDSKYRGE
ncbi:MAG: hypothetical protein ABEJ72_07615, partial [Candidatus Aenigmatarchaeota archaeon]